MLARGERVEEPPETRPAIAEDGAGDAVVHIDMLVGDRPAFARGVCPGVFHLSAHRRLGEAVLLRALPRVDCRDNQAIFLLTIGVEPSA
jgi:hypothetical protein